MAAKRRGIALIFVVITLAVLSILATVVLANTAGARQRDRVTTAIAALERFGFEIGVNGKRPSFVGDVGRNPGRLSHMYVSITIADSNSCKQPYSGAEVSRWLGPYHLIPMVRDENYQFMPGLVASDTLERIPATGGANPILAIVMRSVQIELAQDLGLAFDGISTGAGPKITFLPSGTNPVDVRYNIPITAC